MAFEHLVEPILARPKISVTRRRKTSFRLVQRLVGLGDEETARRSRRRGVPVRRRRPWRAGRIGFEPGRGRLSEFRRGVEPSPSRRAERSRLSRRPRLRRPGRRRRLRHLGRESDEAVRQHDVARRRREGPAVAVMRKWPASARRAGAERAADDQAETSAADLAPERQAGRRSVGDALSGRGAEPAGRMPVTSSLYGRSALARSANGNSPGSLRGCSAR